MSKKDFMVRNYRGVAQALIIMVAEGDGTREDPHTLTQYVIDDGDGQWRTIGKVVPLSDEEHRAIGCIN